MPPDLTILALNFAAERDRLELDCVAMIVANPVKGARTAGRVGFKLDLLKRDDLRLIAGAVRDLIAAKLVTNDTRVDRRRVFWAARHELKAAKFWDDMQPTGNLGSMLWSNRTLYAYLRTWFYSEGMIARTVARLADMARREQAIAAHQAAVVELMTVSNEPAIPAERAA